MLMQHHIRKLSKYRIKLLEVVLLLVHLVVVLSFIFKGKISPIIIRRFRSGKTVEMLHTHRNEILLFSQGGNVREISTFTLP